ncbi:PREDICTED: DDB1- and CUL4-associated factor 8-like protein 2 [Cyphomyrmex costatus]|uniref:DDB1- and CUL4-associated factor 8-like protein 2 n=1 Tax=Cyphomyrmex costatus TaxID=456900 RepID=UPI0008522144|nr:PREDICTED: DDB1- and CUL4-associated factor 8-like protein 2 [Cyphomyrmex costatus]
MNELNKEKEAEAVDYTVRALNFNQKENSLARASHKKVSIWDWAARKKRCCIPNGHNSLDDAKWLPLDVENFMVTSGSEAYIHNMRLLDLEYNSSSQLMNYDSLFHPTRIYQTNVCALAVHPEIPYVVFSAYNDSILSMDIREDTPKLLDIKSLGNGRIRSIHCNPSNSYEFCVGGDFPCVRVYDQRNISKPLYQLWTTKYNKVIDHRCLGHPHIPILATASSRKSNVLIWMPSSNEDPIKSSFKTYLHEDLYNLLNNSTDNDQRRFDVFVVHGLMLRRNHLHS